MLALLKLFLDIALLKKGPQDVPYSLFLLILIFAVSFTLDVVIGFIPDHKGHTHEIFVFLRYLVVANIVVITTMFLVFKLFNKAQRFLQSLTAMIGVEMLLKLFQIPAFILVADSSKNEATLIAGLAGLFLLFALFWYLAIYTHIFRNALSISIIFAGMLAMAFLLLSFFMHALLIPVNIQ